MNLVSRTPEKTLRPALLRQPVPQDHFAAFQKHLARLQEQVGIAKTKRESEEHVKTILRDFLRAAFYAGRYNVNTSDRIDLVICNGSDATSKPAVLFEVKRPGNDAEMISTADNNRKAFHEAVLYYLRERIENGNNDVKAVVITDVVSWFVFDALEFDQTFIRDKKLVKKFNEWRKGKKSSTGNQLIYDEIRDTVAHNTGDMPCAHFVLHVGEGDLLAPCADPAVQTAIFKLLSPEHLLKQDLATDRNTLNKAFYAELLHIIGLEEVKEGGKKVIRRKRVPDEGSLIENAIARIESEDVFDRVQRRELYGETHDEQVFGIALELCVTWVNRLIFLKLLEGQLVVWHGGDRERHTFVNTAAIGDFDRLNTLFFDVLAVKEEQRHDSVARDAAFKALPYLNSSLFEPTLLERHTIRVSNLEGGLKLPVLGATVLVDGRGRQRKNESLPTLEYLLLFLGSYDYGAEVHDGVQATKRTIITAPVLGLIFEKINGYREGSVFTPGSVTMALCRATLRHAVIQAFNTAFGWSLDMEEDLTELHNKIHSAGLTAAKANKIVNGLRIADISVGSGHFLVSAVNELIAIKAELEILCDRKGKTMHNLGATVEDDELIVTVEDGTPFAYAVDPSTGKPHPGAQRIQEALFQEKQTLIEDCLFGVDINPNSVKICWLRLWIELLKHAYYTETSGYTRLQTLPNIDINIRCGNSLFSRYTLDIEFEKTRQDDIRGYFDAVRQYKNADDKTAKREIENRIEAIKAKYSQHLRRKNTLVNDLETFRTKLRIEEHKHLPGLEPSAKERVKIEKRIESLRGQIARREEDVRKADLNATIRSAFEWRFEFPEALDADGKFAGFDVVIGNPPYVRADVDAAHTAMRRIILDSGQYETLWEKWDWFVPFIERGFKLLKPNGFISYIVSDAFCHAKYAQKAQEWYLQHARIIRLDFMGTLEIFDVGVRNMTFLLQKATGEDNRPQRNLHTGTFGSITSLPTDTQQSLSCRAFFPEDQEKASQVLSGIAIDQICYVSYGLRPNSDERDAKGEFRTEDVVSKTKDLVHCKPYVEGKHLDRWLPITNLWIEWNTDRAPAKFCRPTFNKLYEVCEKLIAQRSPGANPVVCYDDNHLVFTPASVGFVPWHLLAGVRNRSLKKTALYKDEGHKDSDSLSRDELEAISHRFAVKYLLAVMNSSVAREFLRAHRRSNIHLYPDDWKNLPVPDITPEQQQPIVAVVDKILAAKKADPKADIKALEDEVDALVRTAYHAGEGGSAK